MKACAYNDHNGKIRIRKRGLCFKKKTYLAQSNAYCFFETDRKIYHYVCMTEYVPVCVKNGRFEHHCKQIAVKDNARHLPFLVVKQHRFKARFEVGVEREVRNLKVMKAGDTRAEAKTYKKTNGMFGGNINVIRKTCTQKKHKRTVMYTNSSRK